MLKNISSLGTTLEKEAQKTIKGGGRPRCYSNYDCFLATGDLTDRCINNYCFFF
ncbi:hypothetical protein [Tenacibaculum sp. M341]|uniref:hypothetical protein n=1 Tax=Tenacibaculum sp. M341 TaxID=2530339 RepID=UPI001404851F|nr:hypothetical protein [Tenacibaculum sp. M341]